VALIVSVIVLLLLGFVAVSVVMGGAAKVLKLVVRLVAGIFLVPVLVMFLSLCLMPGTHLSLTLTVCAVVIGLTVCTLDLTPGGVCWMLLDAAYKTWKQKDVRVLGCGHEHTEAIEQQGETQPVEQRF
jgi:hypothetical protein